MSEMTDDDRWYARRLPDDYIARGGDAFSRVSAIVAENWWQHQGRALTELVELLLPILEPLQSPDDVADDVRSRCEEVVSSWFAGLGK